MNWKCSVHGVEAKHIPAGVSKTSGKPYPAFDVCPVTGCKEKPPSVPLSPEEPIDQPFIKQQREEDFAHEAKRSYRIERQHSQEMAIRYLELKYKYEPPAENKLHLSEKIKLMTEYFMQDLEKKDGQ